MQRTTVCTKRHFIYPVQIPGVLFLQVYLERTLGSNTGILTWKIDFASCGLVVDQVSIKVESRCINGGDVLVMLASGERKKTISHMEGKSVFLWTILYVN